MTYDTTTNYALKKPTVTNDDDAWGGHLNESLDDIDTELKAVSDVADQAAADAADALAAVGGAALITILDFTADPLNDDQLDYDVATAANLGLMHRTTAKYTVINITSTMTAGKGVRKTLIGYLGGGGVFRFQKGTGVDVLVTDIGGSGSGGATFSTQGRNVFEIYATKGGFGNPTEVVVKRIGVTTV